MLPAVDRSPYPAESSTGFSYAAPEGGAQSAAGWGARLKGSVKGPDDNVESPVQQAVDTPEI